MTDKEKALLDYMYGQAENLKAYMERNGFTDCKIIAVNLFPGMTSELNGKEYTYDGMSAGVTFNDGRYLYRGFNPVYDRSFYGEY